MTTNPNEPINPCTIKTMKTTTVRPGWDYSEPELVFVQGLTKREHFAAMAMQGLLSNGRALTQEEIIKYDGKTLGEVTSIIAVSYADTLVNELNK
jgi:hypothetical protein